MPPKSISSSSDRDYLRVHQEDVKPARCLHRRMYKHLLFPVVAVGLQLWFCVGTGKEQDHVHMCINICKYNQEAVQHVNIKL